MSGQMSGIKGKIRKQTNICYRIRYVKIIRFKKNCAVLKSGGFSDQNGEEMQTKRIETTLFTVHDANGCRVLLFHTYISN